MTEEKLTGAEKAAGAAVITVLVVIGMIIGMALMYGWLALNGQIVALQKAVEAVMLMVA